MDRSVHHSTSVSSLGSCHRSSRARCPRRGFGHDFTYQGRLSFDGQPVDNACDFHFNLYDDDLGDIQIRITQTITDVAVSGGLFTVQLDFGPGAFQGDARWLGCRCLFDIPLIGSQVIAPQDIVGRYSAFELVIDAADLRITRTVTLNVSCPPGTPSWFFADPPQMCPDELALHSQAAAQRFEHGLMIWLSEQDTYYILYDHLLPPSEGTVVSATITSVQIIRGPLDLEPGASPANRVGEDPPAGYAEPVSGFGLVWRGEVQGVRGVRERLGWALAEEVSYMSAYQCEPAYGSHWNCYLLGPDDTVFHLSYNAHLGYLWQIWGQMED